MERRRRFGVAETRLVREATGVTGRTTVGPMTAIEPAHHIRETVVSTPDQLEAVCPRHGAEFYEGSFHVNPPASVPHDQAILVLARRLLNSPQPPGCSIVTHSRIHVGPEVMCPDIAVVPWESIGRFRFGPGSGIEVPAPDGSDSTMGDNVD